MTINPNAPIYPQIDVALIASPIGTVAGFSKVAIGLGNVDNTSDLNKPISTATQTALNLKLNLSAISAYAPLANPTFTGTISGASASLSGDLTLGGNLTVNGTQTIVNTTNLAISDSLIYLSDNQYSTDNVDIGLYAAYGTTGGDAGNHKHTGLIRKAGGGWHLFSNGSEPSTNIINLTGVNYDSVKVGSLVVNGKSSSDILMGDGTTTATSSYALTSGLYSNPSWITGLAWSKISTTPTTLSGYGITDAATATHIHGNISNTGTLNTVISPASAAKIVALDGTTNAIGTLTAAASPTTTFLRGDGTWQVTYSSPLTLTSLSTGFSIAGGTTSKTLQIDNTLEFAGTDSTKMTFPATSDTLAGLGTAQTFTATQTFSASPNVIGLVTSSATITLFSSTATNITLGSAATTLTFASGSSLAQTINIGTASTGASTYNLGTGATVSATTKTVNIGTAGVSGSITNVNLGSAVSGSTGTTKINTGLSLSTPPAVITGTTYTQLVTDTVLVFNTSAACTVTLLSAATYPGKILWMKQIAAFAVTASASSGAQSVQPLGSTTEGSAILSGAGKFAQLVSNGTDWVIMSAN